MKMPQLSQGQASVYALLAFLSTIAVNAWIPGYSIVLSGLLVVIFLSVFVSSRSSTLIAGGISLLVVISFLVWDQWRAGGEPWTQYLFIGLLILFTTLIVLYIKSLIRAMQFDKSHMTSLF
ncbi:MAG: hypothetical protein EOO15_24495, partial [Chitinophagaceae bacterium]